MDSPQSPRHDILIVTRKDIKHLLKVSDSTVKRWVTRKVIKPIVDEGAIERFDFDQVLRDLGPDPSKRRTKRKRPTDPTTTTTET